MLVLGDVGAWRDRLVGHGPIISADRPDDYAAARFVRWTRAPRGLRPLRWLRARWWRFRLRGAALVALSWPVPEIAARVLPEALRRRAERPEVPAVLPPVVGGPGSGRGGVVGVGPVQGWAGADLWLRVVHELRTRGHRGPYTWIGVGWDDEVRPFDHERWHLGLDEVVERRGPEAPDGTACEALGAEVLVLSARPGAGGLPALAESLPALELAALPGAPPVVGFAGVAAGAGACADGHEVRYPDVAAVADEVERVLRRGPVDLDVELAQLLAGARRS